MAKEDSYMDEAFEALKHMSADEKKRMEYEAREKAIRDYNSQMESARKEGERNGIRRIIKNMLALGKKPEEIANATGEELEDIRKIQEEMER